MNIQKLTIKKLLEDKSTPLFFQLSSNNFTKSYRTIYRMIEAYYDKFNKLPEIDVLKTYATTNFNEEKAGTIVAILTSLSKVKEDLSNEECLDLIRKDTILRSVENVGEEFIDVLQEKDVNKLKLLLSNLENNINKIDNKMPKDINEVDFTIRGLSSYDIFLPTLQKENVKLAGVSVIQAKTNAGKSIFALNQAMYSYQQGINVAVLSMEMPTSQVFLRFYSMVNNVEYKDLLNLKNEELVETIEVWKKEFFNRENKLFIDDKRYNDVELLKTIKNLIKQGVQMFVIDYLNLIESSNPSQADFKIMSDLVKNLHDLSLQYGIVFVSPVQVHIEENSKGQVTAFSRTSREIDFSASLSILLYQNAEEFKEGVVRVIVNKNRNGGKPTLMCKAEFNKMQFKDLGVII